MIHYIATHRQSVLAECGENITIDHDTNDWSENLYKVTCKQCLDKVKKSMTDRYLRLVRPEQFVQSAG